MEIIRSVTGEKQKQIKYLEIWLVKKNNDNLRDYPGNYLPPQDQGNYPPRPQKNRYIKSMLQNPETSKSAITRLIIEIKG